MPRRRGLSLVETLIVLAILAGLIGLLLPAVQAARAKAREAVCKNNLNQLNIAVANFAQAHKRLPRRNPPGLVGGWSIEVLPFLEQANLEDRVTLGAPIADAPPMLIRPPSVFVCPTRITADQPGVAMAETHYAMTTDSSRESYSLYETPLELSLPWAAGPELDRAMVT
ncbi:MAG: DUF1559 domain-containing protein [Planctomycetota bacterium]